MNEVRTESRTKDWREICKAAANELDPAKLMDLIGELNRALDERDKRRRRRTGEDPPDNNCRAISLQGEAAV
jgi:hypothetical protein